VSPAQRLCRSLATDVARREAALRLMSFRLPRPDAWKDPIADVAEISSAQRD